ncbi:hypothetical protein IE53DRAFT_320270 [Violaceomyces palustris]|uniref:Uncharacterized protein n=1 Tax=Violaceomyces palustris TaxID=1673888 RepID=A0ACD0NQ67_9BASI|nr:hypothetical protein IE53DRAFT_320270 [Violaceomyces palustris]
MDCNHPVQIAGMCAVCGKTLDDDAINQASISMMHDHAGVKVSAEEAQRLDSESTSHLLEQRKLALIVDLDQTIIHATVDPTVGEWMKDENNPNNQALKDVGKFRLGMDGKAINDSPETENQDGGGAAIDQRGCWYYIKPRPGLQSFLKDLSRKYELHVYTMGTRSYADCVCKLVDPDGSLFATRILSRDENGSLDEKSLSRLFPVDTSMVVIIDDRADVWRWSPNLVKVKPFDFFVGIGDINATFLPAAPRSPAPTLPDPTVAPGASESSSSLTLPVASASTALSFTEATSGSSSASLSSPDSSAVDPKGRGDATRDAEAVEVAAMRSQTTALTEQRDARPLAKMQEALDEKLAHTPAVAEAERIDAQKRSSSQDVSLPANGKGKEKAEAEPEPKGAEEQEEEAKEGQEKAPDDVSAMPPDVPNLDAAFTGNHNSHAVLRDDDRELDRLRKILDEIHEQWYSSWESLRKEEEANADAPRDKNLNLPAHKKPTVMEIIAGLKAQVLKDCKIVFSSLVPLGQAPETSEFWRLAQEFGAKCFKEVDHTITHVIASRLGTAKVNKAHRHQDIHVVWPRWLHDTVAEWERRPEVFYAVPPGPHLHLFTGTSGELESIPLVASIATADDANETSSESSSLGTSNELGNGQAEGDFTQMDWALANDEVDAFLDDDEDEDDETEAETEADLVSEGDATDGEKR